MEFAMMDGSGGVQGTTTPISGTWASMYDKYGVGGNDLWAEDYATLIGGNSVINDDITNNNIINT